MILARENTASNWDGKTTTSTATAIFTAEETKPMNSIGIFLITVFLLLIISLGQTAINLEIDYESKYLANLKEKAVALQIENERMGMSVNRYLKPKNLERMAMQKLNMVNPRAEAVIVLP